MNSEAPCTRLLRLGKPLARFDDVDKNSKKRISVRRVKWRTKNPPSVVPSKLTALKICFSKPLPHGGLSHCPLTPKDPDRLTFKGDAVHVGTPGVLRGSVHVTADERLAKHLLHGDPEHGIKVELCHHWQHVLSDKGEETK